MRVTITANPRVILDLGNPYLSDKSYVYLVRNQYVVVKGPTDQSIRDELSKNDFTCLGEVNRYDSTGIPRVFTLDDLFRILPPTQSFRRGKSMTCVT